MPDAFHRLVVGFSACWSQITILVNDAAARPRSVLWGHGGVDHDVSRRLGRLAKIDEAHAHVRSQFCYQGKEAPSLSDCVEIRVRAKYKRAGLAAATALQTRH